MSYIETAARYDKITEDGTVKKVTERFIVEALSCPEAEARVIEEISPFVSGDLEVTANKKVAVAEVINAADADRRRSRRGSRKLQGAVGAPGDDGRPAGRQHRHGRRGA